VTVLVHSPLVVTLTAGNMFCFSGWQDYTLRITITNPRVSPATPDDGVWGYDDEVSQIQASVSLYPLIVAPPATTGLCNSRGAADDHRGAADENRWARRLCVHHNVQCSAAFPPNGDLLSHPRSGPLSKPLSGASLCDDIPPTCSIQMPPVPTEIRYTTVR
jgi:hypothetical protein